MKYFWTILYIVSVKLIFTFLDFRLFQSGIHPYIIPIINYFIVPAIAIACYWFFWAKKNNEIEKLKVVLFLFVAISFVEFLFSWYGLHDFTSASYFSKLIGLY